MTTASPLSTLRTALALGALGLAALAPTASAQITFSESDIRAAYDSPSTFTLYQGEITDTSIPAYQALSTQTGGGRTWDFSGLTFTLESSYTSRPVAAPAPGSDDTHLAQGNLIVRTDSSGTTDEPAWSYYRLDADEFTAFGSAFVDEGVLNKLKFIPGETQPLPYTFGSTWSSESQLVFEPNPFPGTLSTHEDSEVVGWGTLVTAGASEPALMVRTLLVNRGEFPGLPPGVDSSFVVTYVTEGQSSASIVLDFLGQVQGASYTTRSAGGTAADPSAPSAERLTLASPRPNPARGLIEFSYTLAEAGHVRLTVVDVLGREVAVVVDGLAGVGTHAVAYDASGLTPGLYVVRVSTGSANATQRLTVVR